MKKQEQMAAKPQHTNEFLKKRRFLMILPLLVLPFTTMAFWALGGGKAGRSALECLIIYQPSILRIEFLLIWRKMGYSDYKSS
ncbi:hypothetical protein SNE26_20440 [Mucilaginibacter sp. cycad4]|uniref:hypothetical protein n=1 Tax=Mucilaginibacter sp. cycad4 TaxID=3342096 RepID=UPI002AAA9E3C|nr:hypothetical protein [Mucilaginibacter gossypii]WPU98398.1 hypothetical protein SNE26_20440 [Mucilaginibacter gossypii]